MIKVLETAKDLRCNKFFHYCWPFASIQSLSFLPNRVKITIFYATLLHWDETTAPIEVQFTSSESPTVELAIGDNSILKLLHSKILEETPSSRKSRLFYDISTTATPQHFDVARKAELRQDYQIWLFATNIAVKHRPMYEKTKPKGSNEIFKNRFFVNMCKHTSKTRIGLSICGAGRAWPSLYFCWGPTTAIYPTFISTWQFYHTFQA